MRRPIESWDLGLLSLTLGLDAVYTRAGGLSSLGKVFSAAVFVKSIPEAEVPLSWPEVILPLHLLSAAGNGARKSAAELVVCRW